MINSKTIKTATFLLTTSLLISVITSTAQAEVSIQNDDSKGLVEIDKNEDNKEHNQKKASFNTAIYVANKVSLNKISQHVKENIPKFLFEYSASAVLLDLPYGSYSFLTKYIHDISKEHNID